MGNVSLEYHKICKLQALKDVRCGLEGQLKFQDSDVRYIVLEEAADDPESGRFATPSNHFDHVSRRCSSAFALRQAMPASSVLNGSYPCYALLIDAKPQLRVACWFTHKVGYERMGVFRIWISLTQAHGVRCVRARSGGHDGSSSQRVGCGGAEGSRF